MAKTRILPACLVFLLALCLATSADARRWKWWHYGGYDRSERGERDDDGGSRRARAAELPDPALRGSRGAFGTIVERLVSGCGQQAEQLANLPYDEITRIAAPDDAQRAALEALRGTAALAAQRSPPTARRACRPRPRCGSRRWSRRSTPPLQPLPPSSRRCRNSIPRSTTSRRRVSCAT